MHQSNAVPKVTAAQGKKLAWAARYAKGKGPFRPAATNARPTSARPTSDELAHLVRLVAGDTPVAFGELLNAFNARRALRQQPAIDDVAVVITATNAVRAARGRRVSL